MKILVSKALVIVMAINLLFTCASYADSSDMQVFFDDNCISSNGDVEKVENDYYLNNDRLNVSDFNYQEGNGEIHITRFGTELKITFGSDSVTVNGKTELFTKPIYRTNDCNYISLKLISLVFGSDININKEDNTIKITLNKIPILPEKKSFKGTISLPNNEVAPASGISIKIKAGDTDIYSDDNIKYVTIESGKNKVNFEVPITVDSYKDYAIMYEIMDGYLFDNYVNTGYYSYSGTRSSVEYLSRILPTGKNNINLTVIGKKAFTGKINRNGYNGKLNLYVYCGDFYDYPEVNNSDFSSQIPADADKVYLNYNLYGQSSYVNQGFCGKKGTLPFFDEENYVDLSNGNTDNIAINIMKGKRIAGKINFPEAYKNIGISYSINAEINDQSISYEFNKPNGYTQVNYSIFLPNYESNKYILNYQQDSLTGYLSEDGNIVQDKRSAKVFDITNTDSLTQDIKIEQPKIYGVISLPDNVPAPAGGMNVKLSVNNIYNDDNNKNYITLNIPEGQNSIKYEYPLDFYNNYYYGNLELRASTADEQYEHSEVLYENNTGFSENIDIKLSKMSKIAGAISLPSNETASQDINVFVYCGDNRTNIIIPEGKNSAEYSLMAPDNESVQLGYYFINEDKYLYGYYSKNGTTYDPTNAELLTFTDDMSGIDMQAKDAPYISGTISLPKSMNALDEDLYIKVAAGSSNINNTNVILPQGEKSVPFKIYVNDETLDNVAYLGYDLDDRNNIGLYNEGTYNVSGTTSVYERSAGLFSGIKAENINLTLLKTVDITGNIKLPDNKTAQNKIDVSVTAMPLSDTSAESDDVYIKQGKNSCSYKISVPEDYNLVKYKIRYCLDDYNDYCDTDYYDTGYYSAAGTTSQEDKAEVISKTDNLDMTLINIKNIFGTIKTPINLTTPLNIAVNSNYFTIKGNSANFSAKIPVDEPNFTVKYSIYQSPGSSIFKDMGFYNNSNENGITSNEEEAQTFNLNDNPTISFTLPLATSDEYPLQIDDILNFGDMNNNCREYYPEYDETKEFNVAIANKSQQNIDGIVYVVSYDSNDKIIDAASKLMTLPKMAMSNVALNFNGDRISETNKIKIFVWNNNKDSLTDLAKPKLISYGSDDNPPYYQGNY